MVAADKGFCSYPVDRNAKVIKFLTVQTSASLRRPSQMIASVITYSEELSNAIQSKLAEYAALSQSLDRTFPSRLVRGGPASDRTTDHLQKKLDDLEHKRARLIEAGLFG